VRQIYLSSTPKKSQKLSSAFASTPPHDKKKKHRKKTNVPVSDKKIKYSKKKHFRKNTRQKRHRQKKSTSPSQKQTLTQYRFLKKYGKKIVSRKTYTAKKTCFRNKLFNIEDHIRQKTVPKQNVPRPKSYKQLITSR
jgi:hypothetical protein